MIVHRGSGIYQPSINHAIDLLNRNASWIHIFPEAKVNHDPEKLLPFKWGIARLVMECKADLCIVPMYHCGMSEVLPDGKIFPRLFRKITLGIGDPIRAEKLFEGINPNMEEDKVREKITSRLRERLLETRNLVKEIHDARQRKLD